MPFDVYVHLLDNPYGVKGSVNANRDGSYTILINPRLSWEEQRKTYLHELNHIENSDFERSNVQEIEKRSRFE